MKYSKFAARFYFFQRGNKNRASLYISSIMVAITPAFIALTSQVVTVLCGITVTFDGLLTRLQTLYPASAWTAAQLTTILNAGKTLGTFKFIGGFAGGPVTGYTLNGNGLKQNAAYNKNYAPYCSTFAKPSCCSAVNQCAGC